MLITFEGLDFSGKTTQIKMLEERLHTGGHEVILLREPGGTLISEKIRDILLDKKHLEMTQIAEIFLFSAARTQLVNQIIIPALKENKIVICDRFYDSTTAYQGYGRGIDLEAVKKINELAIISTIPDITIFIDIPLEEIYKRIKFTNSEMDRMESSGRKFYEKVRSGYLEIAANEPERFVVVDGMETVESIHCEIWKLISSKL